MAKKKTTALSYVLPIVGVAAMFGVLFPIISHYQGFDSIGAMEYLDGERAAVLFLGYHKGETSKYDSTEALLRDAATGEPIAKAGWPKGAQIIARSARFIWAKSDRGLFLYSATTLERLLDHEAILERNPFLGRQVSRARPAAERGAFRTSFDEATGRLLVSSGEAIYVLDPDGRALAIDDAKPFTSTPPVVLPVRSPCRGGKASNVCGAPTQCVALGKPGKYGKTPLVFHGTSSAHAAAPASFYDPKVVRSGRPGYCVDTFDDAGAVLVTHKASPQDLLPALLSLVRADGTEAWSVPLDTLGDGFGVDLAVRARGTARLYGSVRGDAAPIGGDYGYVATVDLASGALRTGAVIRQ